MKIVSICFFIICLWLSLSYLKISGDRSYEAKRIKAGGIEVCNLVLTRYYDASDALSQWHRDCLKFTETIDETFSLDQVIEELQVRLNEFGVSHLYINSPVEEKALWQGIRKETGIRAHNFGGYLVVARVLPNSPAETSGILPGDRIEGINGKRPLFVREVRELGGVYEVLRGKRTLKMEVSLAEVKIDDGPILSEVSDNLASLKITSFREEYFSNEDLVAISGELQNYKKLVVDLRGNLGGNFAAMLRALSLVMCKRVAVGELQRPREMTNKIVVLPNDLNSDLHFQLLEENSRVSLESYEGYPCFTGELIVLIDGDSASVSEIFAGAIKEQNRGRVWGKFSAGQVLLAVWYNLPDFGKGYSLSIPEALYLSQKGKLYEGRGVEPQRLLEYVYSEALAGQDSWLEAVKRFRP